MKKSPYLYSAITCLLTILICLPLNNGFCVETDMSPQKEWKIITADKDIELVSGKVIKQGEQLVEFMIDQSISERENRFLEEALGLRKMQGCGGTEVVETLADGTQKLAMWDGWCINWSVASETLENNKEGKTFKIVDIDLYSRERVWPPKVSGTKRFYFIVPKPYKE